jgi:2',3'-cyclic-nucleotide 2'-phosphodiesterase (5'-nucleotidase family)
LSEVTLKITNFRFILKLIMRQLIFLFFFIVSYFYSSSQQLASSRGYSVQSASGIDSAMYKMVGPYRENVDKTMNEVLAENEADLLKEIPDSRLGNFLADAYLWAARQKIDKDAEIAFMNHGGVRINRIGKGAVTRRTIYEVMPFDNLLVVAEVSGVLLQQYLDKIAADGGGGGVAGVRFAISEKKAVAVMVNGKPLDLNRTYKMVNSDYTLDSGSGIPAFKTLKQVRSGYLMRDAIIHYCQYLQQSGKKISVEPQMRITK